MIIDDPNDDWIWIRPSSLDILEREEKLSKIFETFW